MTNFVMREREIAGFREAPMIIGEKNSGKSKVERAGYIPAKTQIEQLFAAGQRLDAYRRDLYEFGPDDAIPDDYEPIAKDFDAADAAQAALYLGEKQAWQEETKNQHGLTGEKEEGGTRDTEALQKPDGMHEEVQKGT